MDRSFHSLFASVATIGFLLLLSGCSQRPSDVDLIFINGAEPESVDPAVITGQLEGRLCNALLEGLARRDAKGNVIPGAASQWELSDQGRVYTFTIRSEAKWSNGDPVTAYDFEWSWKRILLPETACKYAEILFIIKNAEAFNKGQLTDFNEVGIKALDKQTLRVELTAPAAFFPGLVAFTTYRPVHRPTIEEYGDLWYRPENFVGNGAYLLHDWKINDRVKLKKSETYWDRDQVQLKRIDALAISSATTAFNIYATNQADLILDKGLVPPLLIEKLRKRKDFHSYTYLASYFYRFNCSRPPFDDPNVRKAFSLAIDKLSIVEGITKAGEVPAPTYVPPGLEGYESPAGLQPDMDEARRLLAEAGFPKGKGFPRVTLLYNSSDLNKQIAEAIQGMWKRELGILVELRNQAWATYLNSMSTLDYDIARSSWVGDYADPNTFLDCFVTGRGNNRTGWSHQEYDRLLANANLELDPAKRMSMMSEAEKILVEDEMPIVPLYYYVGILFYDKDRIGGIEPNLVAEHPLQEMYLKSSTPKENQ